MNKHVSAAATKASRKPDNMSDAEWQARLDLAAVYRLCAHHHWDENIYNHCSMRIPGEPRQFLMKRHELLWTEVTASNLVKVGMDDDLDERAGVNRPGFTLHSGILRARDDVVCAIHVHTETGMAFASVKRGLRMISQDAVRFYNRVGYHDYEGLTESFDERERIVRNLGSNRALIMRNHGFVTVGQSAREAFVLMSHLMSAARIQLLAQGSGEELIEIAPAVCEKTAEQFEHHDRGRGAADWPAYLRVLDGIDESYRS
jgi:ribulose-5-phosphate 4-epimerase/fuculose-1-phosphate aldolase